MRVRTSGQLVSPLGNSVSPIDTAAEQAHTPRRASAELQTLAEPGTVDHEDSPTSSPHGLFVRFGSGLQAGPGAGEEPRVAPSASCPPTGASRARRVRRRQRLRAPAAGVRGERAQATGSSSAESRRSEEHTSELQSPCNIVFRLLL